MNTLTITKIFAFHGQIMKEAMTYFTHRNIYEQKTVKGLI